MKLPFRSICVAICAIVGIMLSACSDDKEQSLPQLSITGPNGESVSNATITLSDEGGELEFLVISNTCWKAGTTAEWLQLSKSEGEGDDKLVISASRSAESRSGVVVIQSQEAPSLRHTFNIVQQANQEEPSTPDKPSEEPSDNPSDEPSDNPADNPSDDSSDEIPMEPEDEPTDNPSDEPTDNPADNPSDDSSDEIPMEPEDEPNDNPSDEPTDNPADNPSDDSSDEIPMEPEDEPNDNPSDEPTDNPSDGPTDTPEDEPSDNPSDEPTDTPEDEPTDNPSDNPSDEPTDNPSDDPAIPPTPPSDEPTEDFTLISRAADLLPGKYFIGGYRDDGLHLATEGLTEGHCNTTQYTFNEDGSLTPTTDKQAIEIVLESASQPDAYYIYFANQGYLHATTAAAGALEFSDQRAEYWIFGDHQEGGLTITQSGSVGVSLTFSLYARIDALLRSIAADEECGPIILWRHNK